MKLRFFLFCCLFSLLHMSPATAQKNQKYVVPTDYSFESAADYKKFAPEMLKCIDWLQRTKIKDDDEEYGRALNLLGEWTSGCPFIDFTKNMRIDAVFNDDPQLRIYFLAGWAKNEIENNYKVNKIDNYLAGLRCALKAYKFNDNLPRSQSIDEIAHEDKKGNLKAWVEERL
jgi:hypothetical protein